MDSCLPCRTNVYIPHPVTDISKKEQLYQLIRANPFISQQDLAGIYWMIWEPMMMSGAMATIGVT